MRKLLTALLISVALLLGCSPNDPITDDIYTEGDIFIWDGAAYQPVTYATGNVSATANLGDNTVIRGDGGGVGVQDSGVTIDDFDTLDTNGGDIYGFDVYAGNDLNAVNDLDVTDDGDFGGDVRIVGTLTVGGHPVPDTNYAGMYKYNSAAPSNIQVINAWHLVNGFTTSSVGGGWAFYAGGQIPITAYADNGDGKTVVTSAGHTLIDGNVISIAGTTSYDGVWIVEQILANSFVIDTPWVADDGVSVGEHGSHFRSAAASSAGIYLVTYSMSVKPSLPNNILEAALYHGDTLQTESVSRTKLLATSDYQNVVGFSIVTVSTNGVVSAALRNVSGAGDFLVIHANMTLVKLGN